MPISPQNVIALSQLYQRKKRQAPQGGTGASGGNMAGPLASIRSPNTGKQFNPASENNGARLGAPRESSGPKETSDVMYKEF